MSLTCRVSRTHRVRQPPMTVWHTCCSFLLGVAQSLLRSPSPPKVCDDVARFLRSSTTVLFRAETTQAIRTKQIAHLNSLSEPSTSQSQLTTLFLSQTISDPNQKTHINMSTTVHVQGISHQTTEKEVKVSSLILLS